MGVHHLKVETVATVHHGKVGFDVVLKFAQDAAANREVRDCGVDER